MTKVRNFKKTNNIPFKDSVKLFYDNKILDDEIFNKMPLDIIEKSKVDFDERFQNLKNIHQVIF